MEVRTIEERACRKTQPMLSEYIDNTLSARDVWEVEKHLAACPDCAGLAHKLRDTVELLHAAPAFDTSDRFMAHLHERLDSLGPVSARRSPISALRDWLADHRVRLNARPIPTLSFGMATFVFAAILFSSHRVPSTVSALDNTPAVSQEALGRHVAVTASNPFDDPVAAKLEAETNYNTD